MKSIECLEARNRLRKAVRKGEIVKPNKCESCKKIIKNPRHLHGHHPNGYKDPFDIQWLCHWCHEIAHAGGTLPPPPNMAWCCDCGKFLPKIQFNKDSTRYDGLRKYCKKHQAKRKDKYLGKKRGAKPKFMRWNTYIRYAANAMGQ